MNLAKQSTAKSFLVGPILDADGAAKTDEVVASIKVTKNGSVGAPNGSSTLTHNHTGHYVYAANAGDLDTLGEVEFSLNSGTNAMQPVKFQVVPAGTYASLVSPTGTEYMAVDVEYWDGGAVPGTNVAGVPYVDAAYLVGTQLTETSAGYLAAAFKKLFDVETPVLTSASVNQTGDSYGRIGAAGASLTDLGGMSTTMKAQVEAEANDALVALNLDHLLKTDTTVVADGDLTTYVADGSVMSHLMTAAANTSDYKASTDSVQAIRDQGDSAWITATATTCSDKTGFSLLSTGLDLVTAWTTDITGTVSGNSVAGDQMALTADAITSAKIADNAFSAEHFAASSLDGKGDWNTTVPDAEGTAASLIGDLQTHGDSTWATATGFAEPGDAMALTSGERITLAAAIEAAIINELDGTAVMQAIADLIASDMTTTDLTVAAIASACRDAILNRVLAGNHDVAGSTGKLAQNLDAAISTRSSHTAAEVYTAFGTGGNLTAVSLTADQSGVTIGTVGTVSNPVATDSASRTASKADVSALALEATLTAIKGAGWSTETLTTIEAAVSAISGDASSANQDAIIAHLVAMKGAGWVDENLTTIGGLIDAIKAKTDGLNFTGDDVKATLDGEEVVTDSASRTASKATTTDLANLEVDVTKLLGADLSGTPAQVAAGLSYFFDVVAPTKTINDVGVAGSGLTAQEVWEYAARTLTSGLTAQEVWEYVTRTLTAGSESITIEDEAIAIEDAR